MPKTIIYENKKLIVYKNAKGEEFNIPLDPNSPTISFDDFLSNPEAREEWRDAIIEYMWHDKSKEIAKKYPFVFNLHSLKTELGCCEGTQLLYQFNTQREYWLDFHNNCEDFSDKNQIDAYRTTLDSEGYTKNTMILKPDYVKKLIEKKIKLLEKQEADQ